MNRFLLVILALSAGYQRQAAFEARPILLTTTRSFEDTGLLDELVRRFKEAGGGPQVKAIAVGSGETLAMGSRGEVDVLVVHAPKAEEDFMAAGDGVSRCALWHNDYVLVGPPADPAEVRGAKSATAALTAIAAAKARWASRGDKSCTHKKEQELLAAGGLTPWAERLSPGQGMGETLRIADEKNAYTLANRGTWLALKPSLHPSRSLRPARRGEVQRLESRGSDER